MAADLKFLHGELPGEVGIADRTRDDKHVDRHRQRRRDADHLPPVRPHQAARCASCSPPGPSSRAIAWRPCTARSFASRDGLELPSYLTLPHGKRPRPPSAAADGAGGARRTVGARRLRLRCGGAVAGGSRLCRAVGELPRLDRLRQGVHQCRRPGMGPQDARRPDRCGRMGGRQRHRHPRPHRHHGRLVRRLCGAGRPHVHAGGVLLRRRHRRALQPGDAAGDHPALLGRVLRDAVPPRRRSEDRGGPQAAVGALAAATSPATSPSRC